MVSVDLPTSPPQSYARNFSAFSAAPSLPSHPIVLADIKVAMNNHHKPPGRSVSMPAFEEPAQSPEHAELQAWQRSVEVAQSAVRNGMHGNSYQSLGM